MQTAVKTLKAPFPYFGGKSRVAELVWRRFGEVRNYVEPFAGSLAVLLGRPAPFVGTETVNDADGLVSNFWRALQDDPDAVAFHADWPVNENDLHARHAWLVSRKDPLQARLEGDPAYYDAKVAGWWAWGVSCWIGSGFCSGRGPWQVIERDGVRQLVHLGNAGRGVNRQLVHLGNAGQGVNRKRVHLGGAGQGVNRQRVHLGGAGQGVNRQLVGLYAYLGELAERLRRVRVCCGDWTRVCGPTPTVKLGVTAVCLDPPYAHAERNRRDLYRVEKATAADVRRWALEHGKDSRLRICLAGYEGEHDMPGWDLVRWKAGGGYGTQGTKRGRANAGRECLWFSPQCLEG